MPQEQKSETQRIIKHLVDGHLVKVADDLRRPVRKLGFYLGVRPCEGALVPRSVKEVKAIRSHLQDHESRKRLNNCDIEYLAVVYGLSDGSDLPVSEEGKVPQVVIFDLDDTIANTSACERKLFKVIAECEGVPPLEWERHYNEKHNADGKAPLLFPGMVELICALKESGKKVAIITDSGRANPFLQILQARLGEEHRLDSVQCYPKGVMEHTPKDTEEAKQIDALIKEYSSKLGIVATLPTESKAMLIHDLMNKPAVGGTLLALREMGVNLEQKAQYCFVGDTKSDLSIGKYILPLVSDQSALFAVLYAGCKEERLKGNLENFHGDNQDFLAVGASNPQELGQQIEEFFSGKAKPCATGKLEGCRGVWKMKPLAEKEVAGKFVGKLMQESVSEAAMESGKPR